MSAYTQDTWILNVATKNGGRYVHYCRIELPSDLTLEQATVRAGCIADSLRHNFNIDWKFSLTRWELRGKEQDVTW